MIERWERVRRRWAAHGVHTVPPATAVEIARFESCHGIRLPHDLRDYFSELGGMDPRAVSAYDRDGFAIWPLAEVRRAEPDGCLFVIADYLNWSWAYAVELGSTVDRPHPIVMLGMTAPRPVANSFSDFIDLYLTDSGRLYPTTMG